MEMLRLSFEVFMAMLMLEELNLWKPEMLADFNLIKLATTCFVACFELIH